MLEVYRMMDANRNRVAEGLRVVEDLLRFSGQDSIYIKEIRELRHGVRKKLKDLESELLSARDSLSDPGLIISADSPLDRKKRKEDLLTGNFRRAEEGVRVIEEALHLIGRDELAKEYETIRFKLYSLEKDVIRTHLCSSVSVQEKLKTFLTASFYGITSEKHSIGRSNLQVVSELLAAGIRVIQYREKEKSTGEKYNEALELRRLTKKAGALLIVNDDPALAKMVEADGVHLGQDDYPLAKVRKFLGADFLIGLSTHAPEQAKKAVEDGADYIGVGPLYPTKTKKDVCPAVGLEYLDFVVRNLDLPYVAIGGIKEHNLAEVLKYGARCVAMVTELVEAESIGEKLRNLRSIADKYWG